VFRRCRGSTRDVSIFFKLCRFVSSKRTVNTCRTHISSLNIMNGREYKDRAQRSEKIVNIAPYTSKHLIYQIIYLKVWLTCFYVQRGCVWCSKKFGFCMVIYSLYFYINFHIIDRYNITLCFFIFVIKLILPIILYYFCIPL